MTLHGGTYRRPQGAPLMSVGWMTSGGHIRGLSGGIGRRGWFFGLDSRRPCPHQRRAAELQDRVDRTVAYLDQLRAGPMSSTVKVVVDAARLGLTLPADRARGGVR